VDYVLEVGQEAWGIEVKSSRTVSARDTRGLAALAERSDRVRRRIIVYLGSRAQRLGEVEALPLPEFLAELPG